MRATRRFTRKSQSFLVAKDVNSALNYIPVLNFNEFDCFLWVFPNPQAIRKKLSRFGNGSPKYKREEVTLNHGLILSAKEGAVLLRSNIGQEA